MFVWAFASTTNVMVSNLMGQKREDKVIEAITRTMILSIGFCVAMCLLVNVFPQVFFGLFGQEKILFRKEFLYYGLLAWACC